MTARLVFLSAFLVGLALGLGATACRSQETTPFASMPKAVPPDEFETVTAGQLPAFLAAYGPDVEAVYRFASERHDVLQWMPCYCGCVVLGHTHNASCAIKSLNRDGTVTFTSHAAACPICLATTREAMRLYSEGKSVAEIRDGVDAKFGASGPGTRTRYPPTR